MNEAIEPLESLLERAQEGEEELAALVQRGDATYQGRIDFLRREIAELRQEAQARGAALADQPVVGAWKRAK